MDLRKTKQQIEVFKKAGIPQDELDQVYGLLESLESLKTNLERHAAFASYALSYLCGKQVVPEIETLNLTPTQIAIKVSVPGKTPCALIPLMGGVKEDHPVKVVYGFSQGDFIRIIKEVPPDFDINIFFDLSRISFLIKDGDSEREVSGDELLPETQITGVIERPGSAEVDKVYKVSK